MVGVGGRRTLESCCVSPGAAGLEMREGKSTPAEGGCGSVCAALTRLAVYSPQLSDANMMTVPISQMGKLRVCAVMSLPHVSML